MSKSIEPADRRPLVYGIFALLILVAASYLFWPRSSQPDSLVLTPESVRTGSAAADIEGEPAIDETPAVETVAVPDGQRIAAETKIVDTPPPTTPKTTTPPATTTEARTTPKVTRPANDSGGSEPAVSGEWVLNVGAFSTEASARARAAELSRQGMSAHVQRITSDGKTLWRVRVGYFASKAKAGEYAGWMKSTHGIEGWASTR